MIEVGEYVRTKRGEICKVLGIRPELREGKRIYGHKSYYLDSKKGTLTEAFIVKHSKNIIDLIEEGDYVNGYKIVDRDNHSICVLTDGGHTCYLCCCESKDIETIVTKEQFKSVEYIVKEEQ